MWTTKRKWQHEYDYSHHTLYRCGLSHGWIPLGDDGESGHTSTLFYFIQYKTAMAPSIWYIRWPSMQHPPVFTVYILTFGQRFSAARAVSQSVIQHGGEKGRTGREENRLVWRKRRVSVCSSLIFCETGEATLIWSGTSSLISWASSSATSWIVWVCEVREIWWDKQDI